MANKLLQDTHTHTRLTAPCPGLPGTRKVKLIWILLKQETVSGSGISKSAPSSRQPRKHPTAQFLTGRMPFMPPKQQHQSTERNQLLQYCQQKAALLLPPTK